MPRFYFHFTDGERQFSDDEGRDLAGLGDARAHATNHVRELKAAMSEPAIQDLSGWSMTVTDGRGRTVFVLGFDLKPRPVVPLTPEAPRQSSQDTSPDPQPELRSARAHADAASARPARAGAAAKD